MTNQMTDNDKEYLSIIGFLKRGLKVVKETVDDKERENAELLDKIITAYRVKTIEAINLGNHVNDNDLNQLLLAKQAVDNFMITVEDMKYEKIRLDEFLYNSQMK